MIEKFYIKNLRQRRAVIALLDKDSIEVKDLGTLIGALNPRQVIFKLREQGFGEVIKTQYFERSDQDGNRCRPGRYFIPPELKSIVQNFLKRDGSTTVPKKIKNHSNDHDNGRV